MTDTISPFSILDDTICMDVCVLSFFHIYGLVSLMLTSLDHGAKLVTLPRFESESFLKSVVRMSLYAPPLFHFCFPLWPSNLFSHLFT